MNAANHFDEIVETRGIVDFTEKGVRNRAYGRLSRACESAFPNGYHILFAEITALKSDVYFTSRDDLSRIRRGLEDDKSFLVLPISYRCFNTERLSEPFVVNNSSIDQVEAQIKDIVHAHKNASIPPQCTK